ncbi:MAG: 3-phosphoglycerate dehydrogenase family protein [Christensenellales bacterium]|jgi:D-3-phosphoglycerate dehydrogenase
MFHIKTLNSISPVYADILKDTEYNISADIENPDAIIVRSTDMKAMPVPENLKCVARAGAGTNNIPSEEYAKKGIVVFNTPGANANAVRELTITALLIASRDVLGGIRWACSLTGDDVPKQVEKGKGAFTGPEIKGKTLGVIGLGAVGVLVANAAEALGMHVLGYDPYISIDHAWALSRRIEHVTTQDELIARSDYITIHIPLMDSTAGFVNKDFLAKMKKGATLLNLSRGELVVDDDVLDALENGNLRLYVTDFPNAKLINKPHVIAIPHLGASTPESEDNCVMMASQQIDLYLKTGAIRNSVNYPNCELDAPRGNRIAVLHANVPNVVGAIAKIIGETGINIGSMVNRSRGQFAYTVLDLDEEPTEEQVARLRASDTVYGVRCF